jgi:capsid protein
MFGWLTRRHHDKLVPTTKRSQVLYCLPENPREYLDPLSRRQIANMAERLMERFGMVKEGVCGIARHTIGTGLTLQLNTEDLPWNAEAERQFLLYSLTKSRFDIGNRRDFFSAQRTAVEQISLRGEFFAAAVRNPRWENEPAVQIFDTTEIHTPYTSEADESIYDGVRLGEYHNPLGYFVVAADGQYREIPVQEMFHWFEPTGINQVRGQSAFSPVVDKLIDWDDLQHLVIQGAKVHKSLAVVVKKLAKATGRGAFGSIDSKKPGGGPGADSIDTRALERTFPGLVSYVGDGEVQILNSTSPDSAHEQFVTKLITPDVFLALGWPGEFFWGLDGIGSGSQRFVMLRADARAKVLADDLIYQWCNGVAYRFLSHRIEKGLLTAPTDRNWAEKMGWQQPARMSVDNGRDGGLELDQLENGVQNLRGLWDSRGKNYREEAIRQWLREWREFLEEHDKIGEGLVKPELKELWSQIASKWRPGKPGAAALLDSLGVGRQTPPEEDNGDPKKDDPNK